MQTITVKCVINVPPDEIANLERTFVAYADACTFLNRIAAEHGVKNSIRLHRIAYRDVRERFGLSANLTITALRRVCGNVKASGFVDRAYRPTSVSYDARIFSFREKDWTISVTTLTGRKRLALRIGDYQRNLLAGRKPKFATLVKTRTGYAINIVIKIETPVVKAKNRKVLGVDVGIKRLAVASTGQQWSAQALLKIRDRYARIRASCQSKGTKGALRLLKRLSGRESRYVTWVAHNVSRQIVTLAKRKRYSVIALEALTGIRKRCKRWSKHANRMQASWPFGQLQSFIVYKANLAGIETRHVEPAYTSKTCWRCGRIGRRKNETFVCTNEQTCGKFDSDVNAAKNIAARGGACKPPRESSGVVRSSYTHNVQAKATAFRR